MTEYVRSETEADLLELAIARAGEVDRPPSRGEFRKLHRRLLEIVTTAQSSVASVTGLPKISPEPVLITRDEALGSSVRAELDRYGVARSLHSHEKTVLAEQAAWRANDSGYADRYRPRIVFVVERLLQIANAHDEDLLRGPQQFDHVVGAVFESALLHKAPWLAGVPAIEQSLDRPGKDDYVGPDRDAVIFMSGYRAMVQHWVANYERETDSKWAASYDSRLPFATSEEWVSRLASTFSESGIPAASDSNTQLGARWIHYAAEYIGGRKLPATLTKDRERLPRGEEWFDHSLWLQRRRREGRGRGTDR